MKRLIKYVNRYSSDKATFSTCSTEYTVLDLVNDDFGYKEMALELRERALKMEHDNYKQWSQTSWETLFHESFKRGEQ